MLNSPDSAIASTLWGEARAQARPIADRAQGFGGAGTHSFDYRLVYDLVSLTWYALAARTDLAVAQVKLGELFALLASGPTQVRAICSAILGPPPSVDPGDDTPAAAWHWLSICWGHHRRPDVPCGIAAGHPQGTGIDVGTGWAGSAVAAALVAQRGGLLARTLVTIVDGPHAGCRGIVRSPAWLHAPTGHAVADGPPGAYQVSIDGISGEQLLPAQALRAQSADQ